MANHQGAAHVGGIGGDLIHHFGQRLLDGKGLTVLADFPLGGGAHEQLDLQCPGDYRLELGEPAVFPQVLQALQHKQGLHLVDELLHLGDHPLEGHPR